MRRTRMRGGGRQIFVSQVGASKNASTLLYSKRARACEEERLRERVHSE